MTDSLAPQRNDVLGTPPVRHGFTDGDLRAIGRAAAADAWSQGMTVHRPEGSVVPIPLICEPQVLPRTTLRSLAAEAKTILSGAVKLARHLVRAGDPRDREALLGPFHGLEREAMRKLFADAPCPAVLARVDFLVPEAGGAPKALELNTTIPAMQAYADLAAHGWIRAAAARRGLPPWLADALVARCGSHMEALRETLVHFYRVRGGRREHPSVALVARPGDAQLAEQRRLAEHFRRRGHHAETLVPTTCAPEEFDVLYRHVWAHRTPADAPFARALLRPESYVLANPVNGLLEAKALFARLSECAEDERLAERAGLDDRERTAARALPWTRRLDAALVPRLLAEREGFVIKRNWDYGGKSVSLGAELAPEDWERRVRAAAADREGGGFIVQERVFATRAPATRVVGPGAEERGVLYRDISTYTGLLDVAPGGSVVRAAANPVVNILGGGGLAPVVPEDVLNALRTADPAEAGQAS
ncbi:MULTISPECIES: hypothetical protein [Amycolatopsis]|uniref:Glutathione synthase n=1 Tax=Amycolatopsis bullii TaxID=941987 RepID=A0ABQ3K5J6_9PSEU|nr:hypothetical protein [Amycolatopsis bullii]GHG03138.1 hypothetical protein GCM10017567_18280 [Amycolatopsis bullii]